MYSHNKGLDKFAKEIEKAIFYSEILRNHLMVEISSPETWKQEYQIVYRNKMESGKDEKENTLYYIRLAQRTKGVQRNLSAYDREGSKLTIVPSDLVHTALCEICDFYIFKAEQLTKGDKKRLQQLISDVQEVGFKEVFSYGDKKDTIYELYGKLENYIREFASENENFSRDDPLFFINRVLYLVGTYRDFYIPIVKLETSLKPCDCCLIKYSTENVADPSLRNWFFDLFGYLELTLPLEVETTASNHLRLLSPAGILFRKVRISGLECSELPEELRATCRDLKEKYSDFESYLDDDMVYLHINKEDAQEFAEIQEYLINEKKKEGISLRASIGISTGFPFRLSLLRILISVGYVIILLPMLSNLLACQSHAFDLEEALDLGLLALTLMISLAVYSIDKRFLHDYLAAQTFIMIALFLLQLHFL